MEHTLTRSEKIDAQELYTSFTWKKTLFILFFIFLLAILAIAATSLGSASISMVEAFSAILSRPFPSYFNSEQLAQTIVWELRLPRILMAMVVGAGLAVAGTTMQVILRNPLASPYILGIASGAGFGAALSIVMGGATVVSAFIFSLIPAFVILGLIKHRGATPATMVLAGIAMMYLFSAGTSLLQYMGTHEDVAAVVYWLFGNLSKATWLNLKVVAAITLPLLIPLFKWSWDFNALTAGDETATSLGVNTAQIRVGGMMLASLITAVAVAFLGTIGFIGLVAPHMTRMVIGGDHRFLLPASALTGAVLLLASDTAARTLLSPIVLPVGILTSFFGVPLFLYLIMQRRREYW